MVDGLIFGWKGTGFGNALIVAHVTKIVNDSGISAVFYLHRKVNGLVDVPFFDNNIHHNFHSLRGLEFSSSFEKKRMDLPIVEKYLRFSSDVCGKKIKFSGRNHNFVPVTFSEIDVPEVDVAINTTSGPWGPNRNWPYFAELKKMFDNEGITYIDLNEKGIMSHVCLNFVKKAKLYIGLETGMSHYVSKFANGKALILQSGFTPFWYWAYPYDYNFITSDVHCEYRPCILTIRDSKSCPYDHLCMTSLTKEIVLEKVLRIIK